MRVVVALLLVSCLVAVSMEAAAYCRSTTVKPAKNEVCSSDGVELQWFDRCADVNVFARAKSGLTARQIENVMQASFDTWSAVTCDGEPVGLEADVAAAQSRSNAPWESTVEFIDDASDWRDRMNDDNAVAVTVMSFGVESGRIHGADIEINDWNFNLGICGAECAPGITDLENTLTHEVGHFYGLGHMPVGSPTTMEIWAAPGETQKRSLERDDKNGLCAIYPPGTFPEECTGSTFYAEEDKGCGCATVGAQRSVDGRSLLLGMMMALLIAGSRARRRARR